jgi:hypothetical protein
MKLLLTAFLALLINANSFCQDCAAISGSSGEITGLGSFGNETIDKLIMEELRNLSASFNVRPAFYFFNDNAGHNAYSTSENLKDESEDGTIVFGRGLHQDQMSTSQGGTNVPIILAHEFAHTVARKFNLNLPTKENELFADYLAGGYMFYRNRSFKSVDVQAAFRAFSNMGDNDFTSPDHHGTPAVPFIHPADCRTN